MVIGGNQTNTAYKRASPFPSLDPIFGVAWPFYDFSESVVAEEDIFAEQFSFIAQVQQQRRNCVIGMSVMAVLCFVLACVAIVKNWRVNGTQRRLGQVKEQK